MKLFIVLCFVIMFVGLIMAFAFSDSLTDRGEKMLKVSLILALAGLGAFLTSALVIGLWKGL